MTMCDDRDDVLHTLPYLQNTVTIVTTVTLIYTERIITMNEELMPPYRPLGYSMAAFYGRTLPQRNPAAERERQMGDYPSYN